MWGNHAQILREVQPAKGVYIHTQMHTVQPVLEGIEMAHPLGVVRKGYLEEAALVPGLNVFLTHEDVREGHSRRVSTNISSGK